MAQSMQCFKLSIIITQATSDLSQLAKKTTTGKENNPFGEFVNKKTRNVILLLLLLLLLLVGFES